MPFLPLHDKNPRILIVRPWVTWGVILACGLLYLLQVQAPPGEARRLVYALGMVPATLTGERVLADELYLVPPWLTLVTSMFLHASPMHLIGNMLYLWVFGDNLEDAMGHGRFLLFYLLCGIVAGLAQTAFDPGSTVPTIGASGAVSGVLGGYLILHPKARILVPIVIIPLYLPAYLLLSFWIGFQLVAAFAAPTGAVESVAWWAHIGGFAAGMALIVPFRRKTVPLFGGDLYPKGLKMAVYDRRPKRREPGQQDADARRRRPWERRP